jgi:iron complex outermembrane receptor protein
MSVDDVALLWPAIVQAAYAIYGVDLSGIPAPSVSDIGARLGILDPEAGTYSPVNDVADVPGLKPTITNTVELGYKGAIGGAFVAGIDVYGERVNNFIGQFEVMTPNVFMDPSDVITYLRTNGVSLDTAIIIGATIGSVPVGTVSPEGVADPTAVIVAPRNFGEVELWGADLSLEFSPSPSWQAIGTFSFISKNFFEKLDGEVDLSLNTPENRGTFTLRYRDAGGAFHAEGRARWMSGFRMMSGVYVGDVAPYTLFDLNAGAAIPWVPGTGVSLSVLNIFDRKHREFVGAPEMGALAVAKIHYTI